MYKVSENNLVVQHNNIIEAKYKLSVEEQRLIKVLVSMIEPDDEDFKEYRLAVLELANLLDIKRKDFYGAVKNTTKKLIENVLVVEYMEGTLQVAWLSSAHYHKGEGVVDIAFSPKLKPFLLHLKSHFTSYKLGNIIRLKRTYSIRLYELLKQYEKIGKRRFTIEELRKLLMIDENEYKSFKNFKVRVILSAQEEINEKTDIRFEFTEERKNQKCVAIEFSIYPNKSQDTTEEQEVDETGSLVCANDEQTHEVFNLTREPIPTNLQAIYLNKRTPEEIRECIEEAHIFEEVQRANNTPIENYQGLYRDAIMEGWHKTRNQSKALQKLRKEESDRKIKEDRARTKAEEEARELANKQREEAMKQFKSMPKEVQELIKNQYLQTIKGNKSVVNAFNEALEKGTYSMFFQVHIKDLFNPK